MSADENHVDHDAIQRARDSLTRCVASPDFLQRFYDLFMASSAEIAELFQKTDFERQKKVLRDSLFVMLVAAGTTKGPAHQELERLAERHHELGVEPEMYSVWLEKLLQAVGEHDPEFTDDLEKDWREALRGPIDWMKSPP